jgi:hypothetical protein
MAIQSPTRSGSKLLDKRALQKVIADLDLHMGFIPDPTATAERAQAMMLARGIRPEDRFLSTEVIRMRHEQDED